MLLDTPQRLLSGMLLVRFAEMPRECFRNSLGMLYEVLSALVCSFHVQRFAHDHFYIEILIRVSYLIFDFHFLF